MTPITPEGYRYGSSDYSKKGTRQTKKGSPENFVPVDTIPSNEMNPEEIMIADEDAMEEEEGAVTTPYEEIEEEAENEEEPLSEEALAEADLHPRVAAIPPKPQSLNPNRKDLRPLRHRLKSHKGKDEEEYRGGHGAQTPPYKTQYRSDNAV